MRSMIYDALLGLFVLQVLFSTTIQGRIIVSRYQEGVYSTMRGVAAEVMWALAYSAKSLLVAVAVLFGSRPFEPYFLFAAILIFGVGDWALLQTVRPEVRQEYGFAHPVEGKG